MIPCIVFISLGRSKEEDDGASLTVTGEYTDSEKQRFAIVSVGIALLAPLSWTIQALYMRQAEDRFKFNLFDLALDGQFYQ